MRKSRLRLLSFFILCSLGLSGCVATQNGPANTNTTPLPSAEKPATPAPMASKTATPKFTLPMLKAFLANETFQADLKKRLQLTDEQVRQLEAAVQKPEAGKSSQGQPDTAGEAGEHSAQAARQHGFTTVRTIVGEEKAQQLAALIDEYWKGVPSTGSPSSSASTAAATAPNSVPKDTRIVVNAPAYRLDVFEDGRLTKSFKVGIGYPEFPLPQGLRQAKEVIFNPTWTPPDEPWVESSNKVKVGETVEAGDKLNPLGIGKIPIGLPSLIHGGKKPAQIGGFASHGCVGLTDAQFREFAMLLAGSGGAELSAKDIETFAKDRKKTQSVKLNAPVPVELRYETIVVEDGKLYIYRDVYDMNTNTEENLRAVLAVYGVTPEQLTADERSQVMTALKEMSRDATGKLDDQASGTSPSKSQNASTATNASAKKKEAENSKLTRAVKGAKEKVIEIAALRGKGYPAPVALNTGGAPAKPTASQPRRKG